MRATLTPSPPRSRLSANSAHPPPLKVAPAANVENVQPDPESASPDTAPPAEAGEPLTNEGVAEDIALEQSAQPAEEPAQPVDEAAAPADEAPEPSAEAEAATDTEAANVNGAGSAAPEAEPAGEGEADAQPAAPAEEAGQ